MRCCEGLMAVCVCGYIPGRDTVDSWVMGSIIGLALAGARPPPPHPPTTLVSCLAGWANRASTTRAAGVAHANGVLLGSSAALVLGAGSWSVIGLGPGPWRGTPPGTCERRPAGPVSPRGPCAWTASRPAWLGSWSASCATNTSCVMRYETQTCGRSPGPGSHVTEVIHHTIATGIATFAHTTSTSSSTTVRASTIGR